MASRSVNKVICIGNLGREAETKTTGSGISVSTLRVACGRRYKDASGEWKDETDWIDVVLWRSENVAAFLTKGKQIYVEGRLSTRSYEKDGVKKYVTEVVASELILLGGSGKAGDGPDAPTPPAFGAPLPDVPF